MQPPEAAQQRLLGSRTLALCVCVTCTRTHTHEHAHMQSALRLRAFRVHRFTQAGIKILRNKIPGTSLQPSVTLPGSERTRSTRGPGAETARTGTHVHTHARVAVHTRDSTRIPFSLSCSPETELPDRQTLSQSLWRDRPRAKRTLRHFGEACGSRARVWGLGQGLGLPPRTPFYRRSGEDRAEIGSEGLWGDPLLPGRAPRPHVSAGTITTRTVQGGGQRMVNHGALPGDTTPSVNGGRHCEGPWVTSHG